MRNSVPVNPAVLKWAVENSGKDLIALTDKFPNLPQWLAGQKQPTFNQLETLGKALFVPFGYLFLEAPPIADPVASEFRTINSGLIGKASKNLEATLLSMDRMCSWMREYRVSEGYDQVQFVGNLSAETTTSADLVEAAGNVLGVAYKDLKNCTSSEDAFHLLRSAMETFGVLVFIAGIVGSNTHRALDITEFRAFALVDAYAPIIFINGKDSASGRLFSLLHEFFHLLLGKDDITVGNIDLESICNKAVINYLAPVREVRKEWRGFSGNAPDVVDAMAKAFKLSKHAMAIHLKAHGLIDERTLEVIIIETKIAVESKKTKNSEGGNYWNTKLYGLSAPFARAVIEQTLAGKTPYTEAFSLLSVKTMSTFDELTRRVYQ